MAGHSDSVEERLLSSCHQHHQQQHSVLDRQRNTAARLLAKWVFEIAIVLLFAASVAFIFLLPAPPVTELYNEWLDFASSTSIGSSFLTVSGPILMIACLAIAYEIGCGRHEERLQMKTKPSKHPKLRLSTFPVLINCPFGVVSAAELIVICLVIVYVVWALIAYTLEDLGVLSPSSSTDNLCAIFLEYIGEQLGDIGLYCLAFLFIPVARGSVLLRIINVPFERAVQYHLWLGYLTMAILTIHGLCYMISWGMVGTLFYRMTHSYYDIAVFPGVIALLAGMLMWVTSLPPVRKTKFELFYYTHQLYIVFVIGFALHTNNYIFSIASGGIFLFMLDRFLRFFQSQRTVNVISATCLPGGIIKFVLSKPANIQYNALSFIFLRIRELSWLQWHPFSVSSSPLEGEHHLSVLVKVSGNWTENLLRSITDNLESHDQEETAFQQPVLTASVEGPYGPELPYHLMYENLVLVAGGIGLSPFLAILSDILHRVGNGKQCLPRKLRLVWAIKRSDELPLLSTLHMESICPFPPKELNIEIDLYVTQESEPSAEEGNNGIAENPHIFPISNGAGMSALVGAGNNIWSGLYVITSIVGFVVLTSLVEIFYVNKSSELLWWHKGLIFLLCMAASVIVFGGFFVLVWSCWENRSAIEISDAHDNHNMQFQPVTVKSDSPGMKSVCSRSVNYGSRPNFQEIFGSVSDHWGRVDVGVIVCGPATLEASVAKECRSWSLKRGSNCPIFHLRSLCFDL